MNQIPRPYGQRQIQPLAAIATLLAATLLLSGCPASLRPNQTPSPEPDAPSNPAPDAQSPATVTPSLPPAPPPPPRENHLSPATRSLVTQAHALISQGDLDAASSTLDRRH